MFIHNLKIRAIRITSTFLNNCYGTVSVVFTGLILVYFSINSNFVTKNDWTKAYVYFPSFFLRKCRISQESR